MDKEIPSEVRANDQRYTKGFWELRFGSVSRFRRPNSDFISCSFMTHQSSVNRGRLCLVAAAILWSLGSLFTRLLKVDTVLGLREPELSPLQIAFYRAMFAGLVFVPMLRARDMTFRPIMLPMVACFAGMNALFLSAMVLGPAANAILLQNMAPFWVYLVCVYFLGEPSDRRTRNAIIIGLAGVGVIIGADFVKQSNAGGIDSSKVLVTAMGLGSSLLYATVILCLRNLRDHSSMWLTTQNHLGSAVSLGAAVCIIHGPAFWWSWLTTPSAAQIAFLAVFGVLQMGVPYLLFAKGLRTVRPAEAGTITLLEPIFNPVWAYLVSPETDTLPLTTWIGGGLILCALAWRYAPWPRNAKSETNDERRSS
jgi:DME family drug/metabolite transporter